MRENRRDQGRQRGKATSSRNAVKHGLLSASPVLLGVESPEYSELHRAGAFESLRPRSCMLNFLAEWVALGSPRLGRVIRFEVETNLISAGTAEIDMDDEERLGVGDREDSTKCREEAVLSYALLELPTAFSKMPDEGTIDSEIFARAILAFAV
jgi:hypothetical protein